MKTLRRQCAVAILTLMLAVSTYAGQLDTPGAVAENGTTLLAQVITTVVTTVATTVGSPIP